MSQRQPAAWRPLRLPQRLVATPPERRRPHRCGRKLGLPLEELISIVSDQPFQHWVRDAEQTRGEAGVPTAQIRPATHA